MLHYLTTFLYILSSSKCFKKKKKKKKNLLKKINALKSSLFPPNFHMLSTKLLHILCFLRQRCRNEEQP